MRTADAAHVAGVATRLRRASAARLRTLADARVDTNAARAGNGGASNGLTAALLGALVYCDAVLLLAWLAPGASRCCAS